MTVRDLLIQQHAYVRWADLRCIDAAATVSAEAYRKDFGFSFGTVHNTLVHMLGAQHIWVGRWKGDPGRAFPQGEDFKSLDALRDCWPKVHDEVRAFVEAQTDASLQARVEYVRNGTAMQTTLWQAIAHCADHANYHRGQLNSLIKLAGGTPAQTMFVDYCRQLEGQA
jgi:uncharacterized damage-inducible protein DinB